MFSLYGLSGQDFRGTLEQLSKLPGVTRFASRAGYCPRRRGNVIGLCARNRKTSNRRPEWLCSGQLSSAIENYRVLLGLVSRGDILRAVIADPPLSLWV